MGSLVSWAGWIWLRFGACWLLCLLTGLVCAGGWFTFDFGLSGCVVTVAGCLFGLLVVLL